ncbi:hypothetical protein [Streptomyces chartreusis]|uniref:hypothetical protein n=1 Tax=Streptomyces chartreusis TaxID=1969 RepID=UPI0036AF439D
MMCASPAHRIEVVETGFDTQFAALKTAVDPKEGDADVTDAIAALLATVDTGLAARAARDVTEAFSVLLTAVKAELDVKKNDVRAAPGTRTPGRPPAPRPPLRSTAGEGLPGRPAHRVLRLHRHRHDRLRHHHRADPARQPRRGPPAVPLRRRHPPLPGPRVCCGPGPVGAQKG